MAPPPNWDFTPTALPTAAPTDPITSALHAGAQPCQLYNTPALYYPAPSGEDFMQVEWDAMLAQMVGSDSAGTLGSAEEPLPAGWLG